MKFCEVVAEEEGGMGGGNTREKAALRLAPTKCLGSPGTPLRFNSRDGMTEETKNVASARSELGELLDCDISCDVWVPGVVGHQVSFERVEALPNRCCNSDDVSE
jgi:hypothetical protein